MERQVMRVVAGANLVVGCLLLQGCGMFDKSRGEVASPLPGEQPPVEVQPLESIEPVTPMPSIETAPVELPAVQMNTPYTIQKGDTLSSIAYKYNLRWQDIVAINPGIQPTRMRIGQMIELPGQIDLSKTRSVPATASRASAPKTVAPATSAASVPKGKEVRYVVKSGDTLSEIALAHGVKTAVLRAANNIKGDKILVGQKLTVPGATKTPAAVKTVKATSAKTQKAAAPKVTPPKPAVAATTEKRVPATVEAPPTPQEDGKAVESEPVKVETTPPPAPAADANTQTYTVKEGEDLYAVAIRWGVSPSDLKALNNLSGSEIKAGTVLKIPSGQ